ncbi:hypothetical protein B0H17DRAFT_1200138 [Mycena rosella]|uniref:Uncharacterized protein n=1 Tax=Mycena rosella TaxID=1033263 RepID=A0AAD7GKC0_MYCRO|nr:hypothetical protein B0H17DRAFT_1200138 [Mycena rosella]
MQKAAPAAHCSFFFPGVQRAAARLMVGLVPPSSSNDLVVLTSFFEFGARFLPPIVLALHPPSSALILTSNEPRVATRYLGWVCASCNFAVLLFIALTRFPSPCLPLTQLRVKANDRWGEHVWSMFEDKMTGLLRGLRLGMHHGPPVALSHGPPGPQTCVSVPLALCMHSDRLSQMWSLEPAEAYILRLSCPSLSAQTSLSLVLPPFRPLDPPHHGLVASPFTLRTKSITNTALVWLTQRPPFRCVVTHGYNAWNRWATCSASTHANSLPGRTYSDA